MSRWVGEWLDDLELLDDRSGPAVGNDDRQRIFMLRTNVDEVDVQPVDLGDEVREGIQPSLDLAPVIFCRPIVGELLHRRELHSLRVVSDRLAIGPSGRQYPPAEVGQILVRRAKFEWPDRHVAGLPRIRSRGIRQWSRLCWWSMVSVQVYRHRLASFRPWSFSELRGRSTRNSAVENTGALPTGGPAPPCSRAGESVK